jgi:hypothetical protein
MVVVVRAGFSRRITERSVRLQPDLMIAPLGMPACGRRRRAPEIGFRSLSCRPRGE